MSKTRKTLDDDMGIPIGVKIEADIPGATTEDPIAGLSPAIEYRDLRQWLAIADELGEVEIVKGANWQEEIGMAAELVLRSDTTPCVVFEDVPDTLPGSRVLINFFGGERKSMTLGFPTGLSKLELSEAARRQYLGKLPTISPRYVDDGPILENVITGDDVDVTVFPTPLWHEEDGGRYIGTGSYNITRDPDDGWVNCGTYRVMIHNKKQVGFYISPGKHGRMMRDKYEARGESMPVAIVVGDDPLSFLLGCSEVPQGISEQDIIGGIRGEAVEVIKGRVTGLPIPANAEIVLEGFVEPGNRRAEGPFGEWTGYYASDIRPEPVLDVKAIYHRNDPIILGCPPLRPPDEICRFRAVMRSALLRENMLHAGVPDVTAAWAHETGNARLLLGIAIKQRYPGHAAQAGHVAAMCHVGAYCGRYVVVVDEDVDVSDLEELIWAAISRSDPATSIDIIKNAWSTPLDPRLEPKQREQGDYTNSRAIIDACRPWHWRDEFPKVNKPSPELARRGREMFGYLLRKGSTGQNVINK
ncbi:MAG: UbiD family decarboxylase [Gammaproteobacteria bacterium]|nr:UbiD family decarboxylase [Gammaproteobacteria bacterium]